MHAGDVQNGVLIGHNNHLFLNDGGHQVTDYATGRKSPPNSSIINFSSNLDYRLSNANRIGAKYIHVIIPDKQSVLHESFPLPVNCCLGDLYVHSYAGNAPLFYAKQFLTDTGNESYLKTDTHLTNASSIKLAAKITETLLDKDSPLSVDELLSWCNVQCGFVGDLGSKLSPNASEDRKVFEMGWKTTWINNQFPLGNNGIVDIRFSPNRMSSKRVLLFGDSFGRDLGWFLAYFFEHVLFLRTQFYHEDIVQQMRPDIIITENAERYLDNVMADEERPNFFMYPYLTSKNYHPSIEFASALSAVLSFPRPPYFRFRDQALS